MSILLFFLCFFVIIILDHHKIHGALLISMFIVTAIGMAFGLVKYQGIISMPPSMKSTFLAMDFKILHHLDALPIIFTFILVALFDSIGSLMGLSHGIENLSQKDKVKRLNMALIAESIATTISSLLGSTTISPFIENAAGIRAGGRTGFTAVVVALLFAATLLFAPLAKTIPSFATSAALFYVSCLMLQPLSKIEWHDFSETIPAIITLITIPLTFSIVNGVGFGVISYVLLKIFERQFKKLDPIIIFLAIVFIVYFAS